MTASQLIKWLEKCPPDEPVFVAADPEGNDFRSLHEAQLGQDGAYLWPGGYHEPADVPDDEERAWGPNGAPPAHVGEY